MVCEVGYVCDHRDGHADCDHEPTGRQRIPVTQKTGIQGVHEHGDRRGDNDQINAADQYVKPRGAQHWISASRQLLAKRPGDDGNGRRVLIA